MLLGGRRRMSHQNRGSHTKQAETQKDRADLSRWISDEVESAEEPDGEYFIREPGIRRRREKDRQYDESRLPWMMGGRHLETNGRAHSA